MLMQEVVDLQQQQRSTARHAGEVNQRLQSAEQRQKQMVSFLAKLFQNPAFLARLREKKEQREITDSPRVRRKFVKQHQHETGTTTEALKDGQIVRYQPNWGNIRTMSCETTELSPVSIEQSPHYLSQDLTREMSVGTEDLASQIENIAASDELAAVHGIMPTPATTIGEGSSSFGLEDPFFKGKNVMTPPNEQFLPDCFVSFPEVLTKEKGFPEFSPLVGTESITKQEDMWDTDFNVGGVAASSSGNELWGNPMDYGVPEFGVTGYMSESDIWDISFGSLGIDKWPADESPLDETDNQPKDDNRPDNVDP